MDEFGAAGSIEHTPSKIDWATCDVNASEPCHGVRVADETRCWTHLHPECLTEALASLEPGGRLDARGTTLHAPLLGKILERMRDSKNGRVFVKDSDFTAARFVDVVSFDEVSFGGSTRFMDAVFECKASFYGAGFGRYSSFHDVIFRGLADFGSANFGQCAFKDIEFKSALFGNAIFRSITEFVSARFEGSAEFAHIAAQGDVLFLNCWFNHRCSFQRSLFSNQVIFGSTTWDCDPDFIEARFEKSASFTGNKFGDRAVYYGARFGEEASFDESAFLGDASFTKSAFKGMSNFREVKFEKDADFQDATFEVGANFADTEVRGDLRINSDDGRGMLDLDGLKTGGDVEINGSFADVKCTRAKIVGRSWFRLEGTLRLDSSEFSAPVTIESQLGHAAHLRSLNRTDADHLTLVDVDLSRCEFAGLRRPESLRLAGRCRFAPMPKNWCLRWHWLPWRWTTREALFEEHLWRQSVGAPGQGWQLPDPGQSMDVNPARLAVMYRQLRADLEDSKDEPGADDLYYGEMEMRRVSSDRPVERCLLRAYWLVSGYGLRASRSLLILAAVTLMAAVAIHYGGFEGARPGYWSCLLYSVGSLLSLDLTIRHVPALTTDWGDLVRIALRVAGPVLLGLAALAIRGRIKR
jgi:uncharacterized protein YjbI with pentapeptide repeats